jgi:hypothetical protein
MMDRLMLLRVLPVEGDFVSMSVVQGLKNCLWPGEDEMATVQLKNEDGVLRWDENKDKMLDVEFTDGQMAVLKGALKKANDEKKLPVEAVPLYEKVFLEADNVVSD